MMDQDITKPQDLKKQLEAALFASGRKMAAEEMARLCRTTALVVQQQLHELKKEYEEKDSSLLLIDEADGWKLTVREQYSPVVQKIVPQTEITKTMMETLAVVAWKAPVLQSYIIKLRTNKAYDHIAALEKSGFISREKHGRTQLIKLTERFFTYFDLKTGQDVKEKFKEFSAAVPDSPADSSAQQQPQQPQQPQDKAAADENVPS